MWCLLYCLGPRKILFMFFIFCVSSVVCLKSMVENSLLSKDEPLMLNIENDRDLNWRKLDFLILVCIFWPTKEEIRLNPFPGTTEASALVKRLVQVINLLCIKHVCRGESMKYKYSHFLWDKIKAIYFPSEKSNSDPFDIGVRSTRLESQAQKNTCCTSRATYQTHEVLTLNQWIWTQDTNTCGVNSNECTNCYL